MVFLKESEIRGYSGRVLQKRADGFLKKAMERKSDVFLSHSSEDDDLVADIVAFLETQGLEVYVDRNDPQMSAQTSGATAGRLKEKIRECKRFMLMATNGAVTRSRWVPWELGFADATKGANNIVLLPLADNAGNWAGSEYLQLYSAIEKTSQGKYAAFAPGQTQGGVLLEHLCWRPPRSA